jgi:hypothetical protein
MGEKNVVGPRQNSEVAAGSPEDQSHGRRAMQCTPQQTYEMRPFPVPDHQKAVQNRLFAWCEVGVCTARCCALSLALAPGLRHEGFGRVDSTLSERAQAPRQGQTKTP